MLDLSNNAEAQPKLHQLPNLDLSKFICALLIIIIHTSPFKTISEPLYFYLHDVLARVAVPAFFAMSGFLFFRKLIWQGGKLKLCTKNIQYLISYLKKIIFLYLSWSVFYVAFSIPRWYSSGWWGLHVIKDVTASILLRGSYYHLWYLLASIYAVPLLFLLLTFISRKKLKYLMAVLWLLECLTYSYTWLGAENIPLVIFISQRTPIIFDTLFRAVPLLYIGSCAIDRKPLKSLHRQIFLTLFSFALWIAEASILHALPCTTGHYSYLLSTPLFTFMLIRLITAGEQIKISPYATSLLRDASLTVYCLHPFIRELCPSFHIPEGFCTWFATTAVTVSIALLLATHKRKHSNTQIRDK